jgi:hypothetical protein
MINPEHYITGLEQLRGSKFTTYHSPGAKTRAEQLARIAENSEHYLKEHFQSRIQHTLLVTDERDWSRINPGIPYGLISGIDNYVIYPKAEIDNPVYGELKPLYDNGPENLKQELETLFGDREDPFTAACQVWWDNLVVHEFTHNYLRADNVVFGLKWFEELLCNYTTYAFLNGRVGSQADVRVIDLLCKILYDGGSKLVKYSSLGDFERHYVGVGAANFCWYHGKMFVGVRELFDMFGEDFIGEAIDCFRVSDESLVSRFNESCGGFNEWYLSWK